MITQKGLELLLSGFKEFFLQFFEAINDGRLEEALTIAESTVAFISESLEGMENEGGDDSNLFVFVESPNNAAAVTA